MTSKAANPIPNAVTKTLICVDKQVSSDFSGTLYNPFMPKPVAFGQIKDIIGVLEQFFNSISFPQSYYEDRTFLEKAEQHEEKTVLPVQRYKENDLLDAYTGHIATFVLEVRFRQNATWQGTLLWKETGELYKFPSALELIKYLDSAVAAATGIK